MDRGGFHLSDFPAASLTCGAVHGRAIAIGVRDHGGRSYFSYDHPRRNALFAGTQVAGGPGHEDGSGDGKTRRRQSSASRGCRRIPRGYAALWHQQRIVTPARISSFSESLYYPHASTGGGTEDRRLRFFGNSAPDRSTGLEDCGQFAGGGLLRNVATKGARPTPPAPHPRLHLRMRHEGGRVPHQRPWLLVEQGRVRRNGRCTPRR